MNKTSDERAFELIRSPLISEKSTFVSQFNHYVFNVSINAHKREIKNAVEKIFDVKVLSVNTLVQDGKVKKFRGRVGKRVKIKKAYVKLDSGNTIDFSVGVK